MTSPRLARRIPLAAAVAAVVLLVCGALAGVATAGSSDALPERFTLAARHAGDQGTWRIVSVDPVGEVSPATMSAVGQSSGLEAPASVDSASAQTGGPDGQESTLQFEWLPEKAWQDGTGAWHSVHGLFTSDPDSGTEVTVNGKTTFTAFWNVDWTRVDGTVVGRTGSAGGGAFASSSTTGDEEGTSVFTISTWVSQPTCRLAERLRAGVRTSQDITLDGCGDGPVTFTAEGVDTVDGIEAVHWSGHDGETSLHYWFNPGIPEPVRVFTETDTPDGPSSEDERLVDFQPGDGPWGEGVELPADKSLPQIELAARKPWGPDDAGVTHPFPLSLAWKTAAEDLRDPAFGEFLAAHPDAAAVRADYTERKTGSTTVRVWDVFVRSSEGDFTFDATQTERPADGTLADLLGQPALGPPVITYETRSGTASSHGHPLPADLPTELPTVASVLAYWDAYIGAASPGNAWGLASCQVQCSGPFAVIAGRTRITEPAGSPVGPASNGVEEDRHIAFDVMGKPLYLWQSESQRSRSGLAPPAVLGGVDVSGGASAKVALQGALSPWALPVPAAASVTIMSVLAGLAALLWPLVKGGSLMGLFSRVHGERLLEHPTRQQIVALVDAQPGIHYQELLRAIGGGKGGLEHHLRKLEQSGTLTTARTGRYTCYFPKATRPALRIAAPALKSPSARRVLDAIQGRPGISGSEVAEATGLSPSSVSEHVARLSAAGLVAGNRTGRSVHLQATGLAAEAGAAAS